MVRDGAGWAGEDSHVNDVEPEAEGGGEVIDGAAPATGVGVAGEGAGGVAGGAAIGEGQAVLKEKVQYIGALWGEFGV